MTLVQDFYPIFVFFEIELWHGTMYNMAMP